MNLQGLGTWLLVMVILKTIKFYEGNWKNKWKTDMELLEQKLEKLDNTLKAQLNNIFKRYSESDRILNFLNIKIEPVPYARKILTYIINELKYSKLVVEELAETISETISACFYFFLKLCLIDIISRKLSYLWLVA